MLPAAAFSGWRLAPEQLARRQQSGVRSQLRTTSVRKLVSAEELATCDCVKNERSMFSAVGNFILILESNGTKGAKLFDVKRRRPKGSSPLDSEPWIVKRIWHGFTGQLFEFYGHTE